MSSKYMLGSLMSPFIQHTRACKLTFQADEVDGAVSAAEGVCAQASVPVPNTAVGDSPAPAATSTASGSVSEDAEPTTATDSEGNAASSASSAVAGATSSVGSAASAATSAVA